MDTLQDIVSDVRIFLYSGAASLPLSLAGTFLLLGLFTANYAMLFFLTGFLVGVPLLTFLINLGVEISPEWMRAKTGDVCSLVIPFLAASDSSYHIVSQWMAMICFFFGYMIHNAIVLLFREPEPTGAIELTAKQVTELERKASYRMTQAIISLVSIVIIAFVFFYLRWQTGCENYFGFFFAIFVFIPAGYLFYNMLSLVGQDRLSDLFGIANRLLAPGAIANGPVVCLPIPKENVPCPP